MSDKVKMIEKIKETVLNTAPDSEVYLYGSQATGTKHSLSDWNLLILLNQENISFDFEIQFLNDFYELELLTGQIISPLIYSKNDWNKNRVHTQIFQNIKNEGIRIF